MHQGSVFVLNLFDVKNKSEYLEYVRNSAREVARHHGKVAALGKYRNNQAGDVEPRQLMIVVEWKTYNDFIDYLNDPQLVEMHAHREKGTSRYVWQVFDKIEDFRGILKS